MYPRYMLGLTSTKACLQLFWDLSNSMTKKWQTSSDQIECKVQWKKTDGFHGHFLPTAEQKKANFSLQIEFLFLSEISNSSQSMFSDPALCSLFFLLRKSESTACSLFWGLIEKMMTNGLTRFLSSWRPKLLLILSSCFSDGQCQSSQGRTKGVIPVQMQFSQQNLYFTFYFTWNYMQKQQTKTFSVRDLTPHSDILLVKASSQWLDWNQTESFIYQNRMHCTPMLSTLCLLMM